MVYLYESELIKKYCDDEVTSDNTGRIFANCIYHLFRLNKITSEFPTFRVSAGIHTVIQWDKERKYKPNDVYDFHHTECAIPYYDYFLTEHSLRQLVSNKKLGFAKIFHCKTVSDINDAVSLLSQEGIKGVWYIFMCISLFFC